MKIVEINYNLTNYSHVVFLEEATQPSPPQRANNAQ